MDIEAQIGCSRTNGMAVSLYSLDESERIPRDGEGRSRP
jgi:hypothetical protein